MYYHHIDLILCSDMIPKFRVNPPVALETRCIHARTAPSMTTENGSCLVSITWEDRRQGDMNIAGGTPSAAENLSNSENGCRAISCSRTGRGPAFPQIPGRRWGGASEKPRQ